MTCPTNISEDEYIGDSRSKINENFNCLKQKSDELETSIQNINNKLTTIQALSSQWNDVYTQFSNLSGDFLMNSAIKSVQHFGGVRTGANTTTITLDPAVDPSKTIMIPDFRQSFTNYELKWGFESWAVTGSGTLRYTPPMPATENTIQIRTDGTGGTIRWSLQVIEYK